MIYRISRKIETIEEYLVDAANSTEAKQKVMVEQVPIAVNNKSHPPVVEQRFDEDEAMDLLREEFPESWTDEMIMEMVIR